MPLSEAAWGTISALGAAGIGALVEFSRRSAKAAAEKNAKAIKEAVAEAVSAATGARSEAKQAKEFSEPTGNGFAAKVLRSLASLEAGQQTLVRSQQHLTERLDNHLEHHAKE